MGRPDSLGHGEISLFLIISAGTTIRLLNRVSRTPINRLDISVAEFENNSLELTEFRGPGGLMTVSRGLTDISFSDSNRFYN
jgi:hypothetical protein